MIQVQDSSCEGTKGKSKISLIYASITQREEHQIQMAEVPVQYSLGIKQDLNERYSQIFYVLN